MERWHSTVMLEEVIEFTYKTHGGVYADLTFGEGGHTGALLSKGASRVLAFDRDKEAIARYQASGVYANDPRLVIFHARMSDFSSVVKETKFDGVIADLGVSTRQLLESDRGFSFREAGPLDMRMDRETDSPLSEVLREIDEETLADALYHYGDIHSSRRIARRIKERVESGALATTADLEDLMGPKRGPRHPATPLFLALRILVNDELGEVASALPQAIESLKPGGRLSVLTFHSAEDRVAKRLFKTLEGKCVCAETPCHCTLKNVVRALTKKPLEPTAKEVTENPRARSAKLRCVEKLTINP